MIASLVAALLMQGTGCQPSEIPLTVGEICSDIVIVEQPFQISGSSSTKFDVVFVGEGFKDSSVDILLFKQKVDEAIQCLSSPPYARSAFNFYRVRLVSNDSGSDHPNASPAVCRDTPLNSTFGDPSPSSPFHDEWYVLVDEDRTEVAAECATKNYDQIVVLVNDPAYGGLAYSPPHASVLTVSIGQGFEHVLLHEMAHGFAGLGDEYTDQNNFCYPFEAGEPKFPNVTCSTNRQTSKWPIDPLVPIPTDLDTLGSVFPTKSVCDRRATVGLWEGAATYDRCVYRSQLTCRMREENQGFCKACEAAIARAVCSKCPGFATIDASLLPHPLRCRVGAIVRIPIPARIECLNPEASGETQQQQQPSSSGIAQIDIGPLSDVESVGVVKVDARGRTTVESAHLAPSDPSSPEGQGDWYTARFEIEKGAHYYVEFSPAVCEDRYFSFSIRLSVNGREVPLM